MFFLFFDFVALLLVFRLPSLKCLKLVPAQWELPAQMFRPDQTILPVKGFLVCRLELANPADLSLPLALPSLSDFPSVFCLSASRELHDWLSGIDCLPMSRDDCFLVCACWQERDCMFRLIQQHTLALFVSFF